MNTVPSLGKNTRKKKKDGGGETSKVNENKSLRKTKKSRKKKKNTKLGACMRKGTVGEAGVRKRHWTNIRRKKKTAPTVIQKTWGLKPKKRGGKGGMCKGRAGRTRGRGNFLSRREKNYGEPVEAGGGARLGENGGLT